MSLLLVHVHDSEVTAKWSDIKENTFLSEVSFSVISVVLK